MIAATLVACTAAKAAGACAARDLYVSPWFAKARRYAEQSGRPWWILSAKHFVLDPTAIVDPYDCTMADRPANVTLREHRRWWAWHAAYRFALAFWETTGAKPGARPMPVVELLAGEDYHEELVPALELRGFAGVVPMRGLGIGFQLAWLGRCGAQLDA